MAFEREQAIGKLVILRKQIYELAIKAQAAVKEIQEETESFLSDKDFSTMDFKKVETFAKQLQEYQVQYNEMVVKAKQLKEKYNITE